MKVAATPVHTDPIATKIAQAQTTVAPPPAVATKPPRTLHPATSDSIPALKPATLPPPPPKVVKVETPKPVKPASVAAIAPAPVHTGGGSVALQIGAYKSEDEASAAWKSFAHKHAMASAYQSEVKKVDLGDKGVWYRLRLGSFADKTAAVAFCDKLKADGGNCFLAR